MTEELKTPAKTGSYEEIVQALAQLRGNNWVQGVRNIIKAGNITPLEEIFARPLSATQLELLAENILPELLNTQDAYSKNPIGNEHVLSYLQNAINILNHALSQNKSDDWVEEVRTIIETEDISLFKELFSKPLSANQLNLLANHILPDLLYTQEECSKFPKKIKRF